MITIIAAISDNNVIGINGKIPWHLPSDLKRFKELTIGKPIVMGRKTFESIGKPLQNRINIIITKDNKYSTKYDNVMIVNDIDSIFNLEKYYEEIMIIGGSEIYKFFLPHAKKIYLTKINKFFYGDAFFPELNLKGWETISFSRQNENDLEFYFITYQIKNVQ